MLLAWCSIRREQIDLYISTSYGGLSRHLIASGWATLPHAGAEWGKSPRRRSKRCVARMPRGCPVRGRWTVGQVSALRLARARHAIFLMLWQSQRITLIWLRRISNGLHRLSSSGAATHQKATLRLQRHPAEATPSSLDQPLKHMASAGAGNEANPRLDVHILGQRAVRLPHSDLIPLEEILHVDSSHAPNLASMHENSLVGGLSDPVAATFEASIKAMAMKRLVLRRSRHFAHRSPAGAEGTHLEAGACKVET